MRLRQSHLFRSIFLSNRLLAAISVLLAILVAILEIATNVLVLPLTSILSTSASNLGSEVDAIHPYLKWLLGSFSLEWHLPILLLTMLLLTLVKNASFYGSSLSINAFMLKGGISLRQRCLQRFLDLEIPFYNQNSVGRLLGYVNEQSQRSEQLFSATLEFLREILLITFLIGFLVFLSPPLATITGISLASVAFFLRYIIRGVHKYGRKTAQDLEDFSSVVSEMLGGIRVIKSFSSEDKELIKSLKALDRRYHSELSAYKFNSAVAPLTEFFGIAVLLCILLAGNFFLTSSKASSLPVLMTYALTLLRTLPRVNHLNSLRSQLSLLAGSFESIESFLIETSAQSLAEGRTSYVNFQSEITLSQITFTYPGNLTPAIEGMNLVIAKGKTTALVGQSGSGKSTLVDLLLRFYDPEIGGILIDGIDLRKYDRKSWHQAIAVVSQDTFLFNDTIRANITYGLHNAIDSEVIEAARKAHALDFIEALPNGFETIVGNRGTLLSGGQRQRIAIARAILCDPDILILDEATSALDTHSERIVQKAIEEVSRQRTVIVIAHRLSTIEKADQIVVMQDGKILEQGNHNFLMSVEGAYYSLRRMQKTTTDKISLVQ